MDAEAAVALVDALVVAKTGEHLNDLKALILHQVWLGQKYADIAQTYGYTEGHIKDMGSALWKLLSDVLGEKVTKNNCRSTLKRYQTQDQTSPSPIAQPLLTTVSASESAHFVGRAEAIAHLNSLVQQGTPLIVIQGEGGLGKTTLAQHFFQQQGFDLVLELLMAKETQDIIPVDRVVEEWLKQDLGQEPGQEFGVTLGRLKRQLHHQRIGILIDNLEPALDRQGQFIAPHHRYRELLRVLSDPRVQSVTLITSRDRLCETSIAAEHYRLPGLSLSAWQQFFNHRALTVHLPTLAAMHKAYGGNAKAMGILCGLIREDFDGDMVAYWQEAQADPLAATALQNLVTSQIDRLQLLDPDAYRLLCRLGCYRYQEVATVPLEGCLALLWDVEVGQRRLIESLRNRSLVECEKGNYWLHPVVRTEAIARLRRTPDWERANRQAADFWTAQVQRIETLSDALTALEAYYHHVAIHDYDAAGQVILQSRHNQWQQFLPLGSTLYRMGFLQPVLTAIRQIIDHVSTDFNRSELHNILGDLYWITGKIHLAIACQEKAIETAQQCLAQLQPTPENRHAIYYLKMIWIDSLLSIGLYTIDCWQLETAQDLFQQVIQLAHHTDHHRWAEKASVALALVYSNLGLQAQARALADTLYDAICLSQSEAEAYTGRFAYFIQILGQTYANLTQFDRAQDLYNRAIAFAEASHYLQVKARALSGLAEICRYRKDYTQALQWHQDSIHLLDQIGAKCDLAEAYVQLGLTEAQLGSRDRSQSHFQHAIQLFQDMSLPHQVQRINQIRLACL